MCKSTKIIFAIVLLCIAVLESSLLGEKSRAFDEVSRITYLVCHSDNLERRTIGHEEMNKTDCANLRNEIGNDF
jgi:hypothetical protein